MNDPRLLVEAFRRYQEPWARDRGHDVAIGWLNEPAVRVMVRCRTHGAELLRIEEVELLREDPVELARWIGRAVHWHVEPPILWRAYWMRDPGLPGTDQPWRIVSTELRSPGDPRHDPSPSIPSRT